MQDQPDQVGAEPSRVLQGTLHQAVGDTGLPDRLVRATTPLGAPHQHAPAIARISAAADVAGAREPIDDPAHGLLLDPASLRELTLGQGLGPQRVQGEEAGVGELVAGQGIGGALMLPTSLSLLNATFRGRDRGIAFGIWGATIGGTAALGPLLGGWLTTTFSWRWAFGINIPLGAIVIVGLFLLVDESRDPAARGWTGAGRSCRLSASVPWCSG
jgi:hypothetical protein